MSFGGPGDSPDTPTKKVWNDKRTRVKVESAEGPPVYLFVKDGRIEFPKVIDGEVTNALDLVKSKGQLPPVVEICCPRCGERNLIQGTKKSVKVRQLERPQQFRHPHDGQPCTQLFVVTVQERLTCGQPMKSGKGICGYSFRITENVIHPA